MGHVAVAYPLRRHDPRADGLLIETVRARPDSQNRDRDPLLGSQARMSNLLLF